MTDLIELVHNKTCVYL